MNNLVKTLFIGADVGLDSVDISFLDYVGNKLSPKRLVFPNNLPGSLELTEQIARIMNNHDLDTIMFGIEATSFLGWHLEVAILQSPILWKYNPSVFCFNPAQVKTHKKLWVFTPSLILSMLSLSLTGCVVENCQSLKPSISHT